MLTTLVQQLSRWLPQAPVAALHAGDGEPQREVGWHGSRWALAQGADVIELPPSVAASFFPDTQPAFHEAGIGGVLPAKRG